MAAYEVKSRISSWFVSIFLEAKFCFTADWAFSSHTSTLAVWISLFKSLNDVP